jgi:hypothetical protein
MGLFDALFGRFWGVCCWLFYFAGLDKGEVGDILRKDRICKV